MADNETQRGGDPEPWGPGADADRELEARLARMQKEARAQFTLRNAQQRRGIRFAACAAGAAGAKGTQELVQLEG